MIAFTSNSSGKYPINLDYYLGAEGKIRKSYANDTVAATFTVEGFHDANTSGGIKLTLANTVTKLIISGRYVYDLLLNSNATFTSLTGNEWKDYPGLRVCEGIVTINPRATRG